MAALERIAREHDREEVQAEAIDTIADHSDQSLHRLFLELAVSGRSARIRRGAIDAIGESVRKISDPQLLDHAQAVIERAVFADADPAVRVDALDALDELPDERALRALRDIIARHPDARVRREAGEPARAAVTDGSNRPAETILRRRRALDSSWSHDKGAPSKVVGTADE